MTHPTDEQLLDFLNGALDEAGREEVLAHVESSPEAAAALRAAALGLARTEEWRRSETPRTDIDGSPRVDATRRPRRPGTRRVPVWAVPLAMAATLVVAVPVTLALSPDRPAPAPNAATGAARFAGAPVSPEPSFVLVLHGRWPDAGSVSAGEQRRRADEYWAWTSDLARRGVLVAAGDLRWEPGRRLDGPGDWTIPSDEVVADPRFLVGMFALRADSYEEALAVARESPHLVYGGSISVRRVGGGFVTVPGMGDWSD